MLLVIGAWNLRPFRYNPDVGEHRERPPEGPGADFVAEMTSRQRPLYAIILTLARPPADAPPGVKLDQFIYLGDFLNEVSREMGLLDVMPGAISDPVLRKMDFIRRVVQKEKD